MTSSHINRRTAGVIAATLALGAAAPAGARQIGSDAPVPVAPPVHAQQYGTANGLPPFVSRHVKGFLAATSGPVPTVTPRAVVNHPGGGSSDLVYILVGGVLVALGGLGGTLAVASRRRTTAPRSRVAA